MALYSDITREDFHKYFYRSCLWHPESNEVWYVQQWGDDDPEEDDGPPEDARQIWLLSSAGTGLFQMHWRDVAKQCEIRWPTKGYFMHNYLGKAAAFYGYRKLAKQYVRAPCRDTVEFSVGGGEFVDVSCLIPSNFRWGPNIVKSGINGQVLHFEEALAGIKNKSLLSAALSDDLMVLPHKQDDSFILFYHETPIGIIVNTDDTKEIVVPLMEIFGQEIQDYLRRKDLIAWTLK